MSQMWDDIPGGVFDELSQLRSSLVVGKRNDVIFRKTVKILVIQNRCFAIGLLTNLNFMSSARCFAAAVSRVTGVDGKQRTWSESRCGRNLRAIQFRQRQAKAESLRLPTKIMDHGSSSGIRKVRDCRGVVLNSVIGALVHLQIGRAYAMQGGTAEAEAAYQDILALWKDVGPAFPILKQAKAEYAKLWSLRCQNIESM
jgi:hypothetical protein